MGFPGAIGSPVSTELREVQIQSDQSRRKTRWCAGDESLFNDSSGFERVHEKKSAGHGSPSLTPDAQSLAA